MKVQNEVLPHQLTNDYKKLRTSTMDPYEQQLLNVFNSYDLDNMGSLNKDALTQLCHTLQLEDQTNELIRVLLPERNHSKSRATFAEFKDALLAILGNLQNSNKGQRNQNSEADNNSPEREVSPKLVYGSKRYGRRSRPKLDATPTKQQNDMNYLNKSPNVQRSNSQCESLSKKRKSTNSKVKRCTSFPGNNDYNRPIDRSTTTTTICQHSLTSSDDEQQQHQQQELQHCVCNEEMLREAWKKLGVGTDGFLNQTELILVCDAIGLHQLANGVLRQLSGKLAADYNHKISFQELLETLQQDDTWTDLLNAPQPASNNKSSLNNDSILNTTPCVTVISDNDDNSAVKYISLGPDGSGAISIDLLLELWESAGIIGPKSLLNDLGFNEHAIKVSELAIVLDKEIKIIHDMHNNTSTPRYDQRITRAQNNNQNQQQVALLQAAVSLYQTEIRCAKQMLFQVKAEREKLRADVTEADKRAALLAREVDDNHIRMEKNVQQQMKTIDQKHSDVLRQVSEQFNCDKQQISNLNQNLQQKIDCLETEELKLRNELESTRGYTNSLEIENQTMVLQIGELNTTKQNLSEQIVQMENDKMNGEAAKKLEVLMAQLSALHMKNSQLRDQNDEMASEIQSLNREIAIRRAGNSRKPSNLDDAATLSTNDISPSVYGKQLDEVYDQCKQLNQQEALLGQSALQLQLSTSESGFETEIECADDSSSSVSNGNGNSHLYSKITYLEQMLRHHNIPVPDKKVQNKRFSNEEGEIESKDALFLTIPKEKEDKNVLLQKTKSFLDYLLAKIKDEKAATKLSVEVSDFLKSFDATNETNEITKLQTEIKSLKSDCNDLESCIEQLRNEYERCEDYWSAKLDEERSMFEQEQNQNSEKLSELMQKLTDFEAQYSSQDMPDARLPIIEEKGSLEKQYMDLEEEYEEFKKTIIKEIEQKNMLLQNLLESSTAEKQEVSIQTDAAFERNLVLQEKISNLTKNKVEATNLFSYTSPPAKATSSSVDSGLTVNFATNGDSNSGKAKQMGDQRTISGTPCRPRRTRKHHEASYLYNKKFDSNQQQQTSSSNKLPSGLDEPTCLMSINALHKLKVSLHLLEQKNRHLQCVVKQQHWQHERVSQFYWQQHRSEKAEYHYSLKIVQEQLDFHLRACNEYLEKLSKSDFLVKDLYVENAYLVAQVERLQGQCHLLSNYSNESSSV